MPLAAALPPSNAITRQTRPARPLAPRAPNRSLSTMDQPVAAATDEALMLAWARGDAGAFDTLYARHRGPLFRFLAAQLRDRPLAEELYQDVWQRVIAARQGWRPEAAFATWLYRIAHNRLNDHWRAQRHRPPAPADADLRVAALADPDDPERLAHRDEARATLQRALDELPEDQREAVLLRLQQELSLEEIGRITGVGRETVKSRLRYALDKLRARLNP
jgi:RNA polymerase sigma-70 factor (ECF subfamily)